MPTNEKLLTPELAGVEVHGVTRSSFLVRSALAAGAVYGAGAVSPFVRSAFAASGGTDAEIVNFALTLEYLEAAFYTEAAKLKLSGKVRDLAKLLRDDETQHVDALTATVKKLGGTPVAKPKFTFPIKDEKSFLKLAQVLEDTGVSAYNGAGPSITSKDVLAAAGSIVQIEARHAAAIRLMNGEPPAPVAFDAPLPAAKVKAAVKPFIMA